MGPLRGANHPYQGAPPFGLPRGIGCDVVRSVLRHRGIVGVKLRLELHHPCTAKVGQRFTAKLHQVGVLSAVSSSVA
jgi:hypothetical protein